MAKRPAKSGSAGGSGGAAASKASGGATLGPGCRVALFHGPEAYLRQGFTDQLRAAVEQAGHAVQVVRFDGVTAQPAEVLDECRSPSLLTPYKMVVVDDADQFITPKRRSSAETRAGEEDGSADEDEGDAEGGSRRPMVERYVQSPSEMVTLVLRAPGWRKGKLDALIAAVGVIKECEPLEAGRAANWTATRAKQAYGRDMRVEAVERLVEALDGSLARIDGELQKLAAAAPPGEAITLEMVERLVAPVAAERKPWELADCLLNPDPSVGLGKLHQLMEESGIDPVPLRWGCIDLASKVHAMAHEIAGGVPPGGAGRGLKFFFGPRAEAGRRAAAALGPRSAAALLRECVEADWRGKTGQEDPARGLEALVLRFAEVARLSAGRGVGR